ncbi:MAG: hypothetical protein GX879_11760 [Bacteroidales bacterium]|nr:hypothetical protein [Bacteroidales bacterium]
MEAGNRVAAAVDPTLSTGPRDRAATAGGSRRDSVTTVNVPTLKASAPGDSTSWYLRPDGMLAGSVDDVFISPLGRRTISFEQITQFCSTVEWDEDTPVQLPDGSEVPVFPAMPGQVLRGDSPSLNVEPEQLAHLVFNFRENGTMTRWHRRWELSFVPDQRYLVGMAPLRTKTCAIRNSDGVR